jgi:hypothetical protein
MTKLFKLEYSYEALHKADLFTNRIFWSVFQFLKNRLDMGDSYKLKDGSKPIYASKWS